MEAQLDSPALSKREIEVLELVARGLSKKQIAYTLDIYETTAKNHVQHILQKLGAQDRTQAATAAIQRSTCERPQLFAPAPTRRRCLDLSPQALEELDLTDL